MLSRAGPPYRMAPVKADRAQVTIRSASLYITSELGAAPSRGGAITPSTQSTGCGRPRCCGRPRTPRPASATGDPHAGVAEPHDVRTTLTGRVRQEPRMLVNPPPTGVVAEVRHH